MFLDKGKGRPSSRRNEAAYSSSAKELRGYDNSERLDLQKVSTESCPYIKDRDTIFQWSSTSTGVTPRTATHYKRSVRDASYYHLTLSNKMKEILNEINHLKSETADTIVTQNRCDKMVRNLVSDLIERQSKLADYNCLNEWLNTISVPSISILQKEINQVSMENELENKSQDSMFPRKVELQTKVKCLEEQIHQENQQKIQIILSANPDIQEQYRKLVEKNKNLQKKRQELQQNLESMNSKEDALKGPNAIEKFKLMIQLEKLLKLKTEISINLLKPVECPNKYCTDDEECTLLKAELVKVTKNIRVATDRLRKIKQGKKPEIDGSTDEQEIENFLWTADFEIKQANEKLEKLSQLVVGKLKRLSKQHTQKVAAGGDSLEAQYENATQSLKKKIAENLQIKGEIDLYKGKIKDNKLRIQSSWKKVPENEKELLLTEKETLRVKIQERRTDLVEISTRLKYYESKLISSPVHQEILSLEKALAKVEQKVIASRELLSSLTTPQDLDNAKTVLRSQVEKLNQEHCKLASSSFSIY